jgi:porin
MAASMAVRSGAAEDLRPLSARELFSDQPKGLGEHMAAWKFVYAGESFADVAGGLRRGVVFDGMAKLGVGFNLEKIAGWGGASIYANTIFPHGESLSQNHAGDLGVASNIDTYDGVRLYKLWFQQLLDDGRWSVRIGQIAADKECFVSEGASLYLNNTFGTFPVVSANLPAPIFPLSSPGIRVRWAPGEAFSVMAMVFSGDVGTPVSNPHNVTWRHDGRDGVFGVAEMAYRTHTAPDDHRLRGIFKLGVFADTKSFDDLDGGPSHRGDGGAYAIADQWVYRERGEEGDVPRGLSVFVRAGTAPGQDRNRVVFDAETGVDYTGLVPSRGRDITGVAFAYTRLGAAAVRAAGGGGDHEMVAELTHLFVVGEHLAIQPDLQYIVDPGGSGRIPDAFVAGLRLTLSF